MAKSDATMTDPTCKACSGTWPGNDLFIADLGLSMAYLHDDQFFPGWTVVVFKRHATELFHLAPTERIQLMEEVSRFAKVLSEVFDAKKMNYALLGNQLPHIHWHVIPRLQNDPRHSNQSGGFRTSELHHQPNIYVRPSLALSNGSKSASYLYASCLTGEAELQNTT